MICTFRGHPGFRLFPVLQRSEQTLCLWTQDREKCFISTWKNVGKDEIGRGKVGA